MTSLDRVLDEPPGRSDFSRMLLTTHCGFMDGLVVPKDNQLFLRLMFVKRQLDKAHGGFLLRTSKLQMHVS